MTRKVTPNKIEFIIIILLTMKRRHCSKQHRTKLAPIRKVKYVDAWSIWAGPPPDNTWFGFIDPIMHKNDMGESVGPVKKMTISAMTIGANCLIAPITPWRNSDFDGPNTLNDSPLMQ